MKHRRTLMAIGSALLAVAPKCPICLLAYFGIFGAATTSASVYRAWLPPATAIWLSVTVAMLAIQRYGHGGNGPVAIGFCAALSIFAGKFILINDALVYSGIAALAGAVIWSVRRQSTTRGRACGRCEQAPVPNDKEPLELPMAGTGR